MRTKPRIPRPRTETDYSTGHTSGLSDGWSKSRQARLHDAPPDPPTFDAPRRGKTRQDAGRPLQLAGGWCHSTERSTRPCEPPGGPYRGEMNQRSSKIPAPIVIIAAHYRFVTFLTGVRAGEGL